NILL
ncbi:hypothetical protein CISIN_1g0013662mg, partial [Citrus sinensis]